MSRYPIAQTQWKKVASLPEVNRSLKSNPSKLQAAHIDCPAKLNGNMPAEPEPFPLSTAEKPLQPTLRTTMVIPI
jgi:hypothetical protein